MNTIMTNEQEQFEALKRDICEEFWVLTEKTRDMGLTEREEAINAFLFSTVDKTRDTAQYLEAQRHKSHHNPV